MNNKILNFVVFALILSMLVISSLEGLYTFKTVFYDVTLAVFVLIVCVNLFRYKKETKRKFKQKG
ncbi:hypothetical protein ABE042_02745 [Viridibacillus arvi]|uniref:Uncharacterized protein n=1 Tax=Viridibacillus arvi TaxID=263475 RepID=A0A0M0LCI4_9BACL|nr:hypothetical protein [Viridibacillus arvi]KOO48711.1 hypothetical protein AMD00_09750 [Viridibacillus arvi]